MYPILRFIILSLCAVVTPGLAHNGVVAFALPVSGLVIDGDLSDWPASTTHAIGRVELGARPDDRADLDAVFRAGWDATSLYVAIEVTDQVYDAVGRSPTSMRDMSRMLRSLGWRGSTGSEPDDLRDGAAIVVDVGHRDDDSRTVRFALDADQPPYVLTSSDTDLTQWQAAEVAMKQVADKRTYEWRIDLTDPFLREADMSAPELADGTVLSFDIEVIDADDAAGAPTWLTWGAGATKMWGGRPQTRGDVVLVADGYDARPVTGVAAWGDAEGETPPRAVRIRWLEAGARWQVATDSTGRFELAAPAGEYSFELEDPRLGLDRATVTATIAAHGPSPTLTITDTPLFRLQALTGGAPVRRHGRDPPTGKQRGVSWVGSRIVGARHLSSLEGMSVDWIVQTPFGWQRDIHAPTLRAPTGTSGLWGESDRGLAVTAALARQRGIATLLKPHIWTGRSAWRGELAMSSEQDWVTWFDQYERFIVHFARLAESNGMEGLCIGTELSATVHREQDWRRVIAAVREVYGGWIVYAANWNSFAQVPFWDAVDYIGVQAYFPLSDEATDNVDHLVAGWQPWLEQLRDVSLRTGRRVLFTEIGYRSNVNAAVEPWLWERQTEGGGDEPGMQTQVACYQAFFRAVWPQPWVGGAYFWKWFPEHASAGGQGDDGFTPQRKPAQRALAEAYAGFSSKGSD